MSSKGSATKKKSSSKAAGGTKTSTMKSGFLLYVNENRAQWTKEVEDGKKKRIGNKATNVARVAAKHWKKLDDKEKDKWHEKASKKYRTASKKTSPKK